MIAVHLGTEVLSHCGKTNFAGPTTYWTPEQALAVFEFLEMLRDELRAAYGVEIQRAFRDDLMPEQGSLLLDPEEPF